MQFSGVGHCSHSGTLGEPDLSSLAQMAPYQLFLVIFPLQLAILDIASAVDTPMECYFCSHSATDDAGPDDQDAVCMKKENFTVHDDHKRACALSQPFCQAVVTLRNGIFATLQRDCTRNCVGSCKSVGYGVTEKTCTWCCNTSLCNIWDNANFYKQANTHLPPTYILLVCSIFTLFTMKHHA